MLFALSKRKEKKNQSKLSKQTKCIVQKILKKVKHFVYKINKYKINKI